jgi:hypothetical protein
MFVALASNFNLENSVIIIQYPKCVVVDDDNDDTLKCLTIYDTYKSNYRRALQEL